MASALLADEWLRKIRDTSNPAACSPSEQPSVPMRNRHRFLVAAARGFPDLRMVISRRVLGCDHGGSGQVYSD